eukprot:15437537-Alexandrium_andersonii.AAC.1
MPRAKAEAVLAESEQAGPRATTQPTRPHEAQPGCGRRRPRERAPRRRALNLRTLPRVHVAPAISSARSTRALDERSRPRM